MDTPFHNPDPAEITALLQRVQHIAVVGLSPKAERPSHQVAVSMQQFGYHIIPIRPAVDELLGEKTYSSLREVAGPIDLVDVFRAADKIAPIVDDCIACNVDVLWLQLGVVNEAEALRAQAAGITVVMDRCIYRDYQSLINLQSST